MTQPVVPGYVPFLLLLVLEAGAILAVLIVARRRPGATQRVSLCARCTQLHRRTEAIGRIADGVAIGALAFLITLPFVAAGYESGFTLGRILLSASAVVAVLAAAAEINFLIRAAGAHRWPQFRWIVEPTRIAGSGARWLGIVLVYYMFHYSDTGIAGLFDGVGRHLAADLPSTVPIWTAAVILVLSQMVALVSRWLLPFVLLSRPIPLAGFREGRPA